VAFTGRVLDEEDVAGMKVANFAIAGLHSAGARDQDMEEACRRAVHFRLECRWQCDEPDSLNLLPLRYGERRWGIGSEFDSNILEVGIPIRPGEQARVLHVGYRSLPAVDSLLRNVRTAIAQNQPVTIELHGARLDAAIQIRSNVEFFVADDLVMTYLKRTAIA
jgi:hypothetical protein